MCAAALARSKGGASESAPALIFSALESEVVVHVEAVRVTAWRHLASTSVSLRDPHQTRKPSARCPTWQHFVSVESLSRHERLFAFQVLLHFARAVVSRCLPAGQSVLRVGLGVGGTLTHQLIKTD